MYYLLLFSLFIASFSSAKFIPKTSSGNNGLDEIYGDTNYELFKKYRCRVCEDLMVDNLELADGELKVNENLAIKFCGTFVTKVLHNALGNVICNTVVKSKLDEIVKGLISKESEVKIGKQICSVVSLCDK